MAARADLRDMPFPEADLTMFVDGSSKKNLDGSNATGYAVVTAEKTLKAEPLPPHYSAQAAELIALTEACKLGTEKTVNIYTDSNYAFSTCHVFAGQWANRGMITSTGKPITHRDLILELISALQLPKAVAIMKCAAHTHAKDPVSLGNHKADEAAKQAALQQPSDRYTIEELDLTILKDMQHQAPKHEKRLWLKHGAKQTDEGLWENGNMPILPKALYRYVATMSHGVTHISKGGMCYEVDKIFTTYGFTSYSKHFCERCLICAKNNPQGNFRPKPGKFPEPQYPFEYLCMDFIELNLDEGKKYCLVIVDVFTRWVEVFPSKKADAHAVAKALCAGIIPKFGIPTRIYSDNGPHFVNQTLRLISVQMGIELKNHCSYHPQSAGLVERTNQTIKSKLRKAMQDTGKGWVHCLPLVELSMHVVKSAKGLSPFEMMYGRPYTAPALKPFAKTDEEIEYTLSEYMAKMMSKLNALRLLSPTQEHCEAEFKVGPGDWVLINSLKRKHCHSPKWDRP